MRSLKKYNNPFEKQTGAAKLANPSLLIPVVAISILVTLVIVKTGITGFIGVLSFLFIAALIYLSLIHI